VLGLFGRADWLRLLAEVGFRAAERPFAHSEPPEGSVSVFVGRKPDAAAGGGAPPGGVSR
jgi:hypothetical protein